MACQATAAAGFERGRRGAPIGVGILTGVGKGMGVFGMLPLWLSASATAFAVAPAVYTPSPGSAERSAIVTSLHDGDERPEARFTFRVFRVHHSGARAIAYVQGEGQVGGFQAILTQEGQAPWHKIWGDSDGGSNSCEAGALHYAWAVRLIQTYRIDPNALFPNIVTRTEELKRSAKTDPDLQCVGDLEGGPQAP